jgi:signal transduction histidine kinase
MGKETEDSGGWTPPATSPTERALLRKMVDNYYGLHLLQVIQGIVHNLNGPLQIIYIRTEQLQQNLQKLIGEVQSQQSPEVESLLSSMEEKARSSLGSLDDLSAQLKHLNSDLVSERYSAIGDVDINKVIEECLFIMNANMFFKHSVNKTVELADSIPLLKGRKTDFAIIVLSLLQNAAEALVDTEDKNVTIETSSQEGSVIIRIQDSGLGISEQDPERIYDVFYTTKNRSESEGEPPQHAGLGLSLASLVLEEYKGSVACESVSGQTTFTVQIPFNADSSG